MVTMPTTEAYSEIKEAFDFFNARLFKNELEEPLITLQRERRTFGYCSRNRFVQRNTGQMVDEIAMNPAYFAIRPVRQTLSTLVHEMVHQWQFKYGKPGRGGYHNREWGTKMEAVGLMPSATGEPGGMRTGDRMTHYIIKGGPFDVACADLLSGDFGLSWLDRYPAERPATPPPTAAVAGTAGGSDDDEDDHPEPPAGGDLNGIEQVILPPEEPVNRSNRLKYVCSECSAQAWGKPGLQLLCAGRSVRRGKEFSQVEHEPVRMLGRDE